MIIYDNSFGNNTPYAVGNSIEEVAQEFENPSKILFKCFSENQMKTNPDKFYFQQCNWKNCRARKNSKQ